MDASKRLSVLRFYTNKQTKKQTTNLNENCANLVENKRIVVAVVLVLVSVSIVSFWYAINVWGLNVIQQSIILSIARLDKSV